MKQLATRWPMFAASNQEINAVRRRQGFGVCQQDVGNNAQNRRGEPLVSDVL